MFAPAVVKVTVPRKGAGGWGGILLAGEDYCKGVGHGEEDPMI